MKLRTGTVPFLGAMLLLTGCAGTWGTDYADVVDASQSSGWRVVDVNVEVPRTLTVSEENSFTPDADIVWHGEPAGDRYAQVDRIMTNAIEQGASALRGSRRVRLDVVMQEFHSVTPKTRTRLSRSGVHNIDFTVQVFDARTGEALSPPDMIQADLVAYAGEEAVAAVARGETQKVRITRHISKVVRGWLGAGPDARGTFQRLGR